MAEMTVSELAQLVGGTVVGDASRRITGVAQLNEAGASDLSFLHNQKYIEQLSVTKAGCVIVTPGSTKAIARDENVGPITTIEIADVYYAYQQASVKLNGFRKHPQMSGQTNVHASAKIGANANIHPSACIGENVVIGDNATIYPHVTIMPGAKIGNDVILYPSVTIYDQCVLGNRVIIHAGTVIGSDGYGYAQNRGVHHKIPQIGHVEVQDDVEIGGNTVVERAALSKTIIGRGTKIGNMVVVGHNCHIGNGNLLVSQVGIAGSTTTGNYVVMAGQVGVAGHLKISDMVRIGAQSGVMADITEKGDYVGTPAMPEQHARRVYLTFTQLHELSKRVKELERAAKKAENK